MEISRGVLDAPGLVYRFLPVSYKRSIFWKAAAVLE